MTTDPARGPVAPVRADRGGALPPKVQRLVPALTSAIVFGLLLGLVIVAVAPAGHHTRNTGTTMTGMNTSNTATTNAGPFDIELGEFYIKPSSITVAPGQKIELRVRNAGKVEHNLALEGKDPKVIPPGGSTTLTWDGVSKSTQAWCTVPGHKEAGMLLDIRVAGDSAGGHTTEADKSSSSDNSAKIDFTAKPAPDWKPNDPTLKPAPGGARHDITLNVEEKEMDVAPGVKQRMWTFNGQVPGPTLRGKVGDVFTVTLVNKGTMPHSIDFHASKVAPNVEMRAIKPGEKLTYQFKADYAGIYYYHCGVAPMLHHIANGMYGALIVDPPDLAPVAQEFVVEQAELYTGPAGQPGDLKKMMAEQADAVVFNGYVNQYVHKPVAVRQGERVRVWVLNAGINENSSFHVIGTIFDTVYKEGSYLLRPDARKGGSQALDLMPAQGGFVEFTLDRDGTYPFVTHKLAPAHKGAMGIFQVGGGQ